MLALDVFMFGAVATYASAFLSAQQLITIFGSIGGALVVLRLFRLGSISVILGLLKARYQWYEL